MNKTAHASFLTIKNTTECNKLVYAIEIRHEGIK